jgi:hypothetical protein
MSATTSDNNSSTNLFQASLGGTSDMNSSFLGPTYDYSKNINTPDEMGMSGKGNWKALGNDINGLISYTQLLVEGDGPASKTGSALGNKFFLQTGQKCNDIDTQQQVDRFIYVDNVPEGNIPFISSGMGVNFSSFRGLIPGILSNLNVLSPYGLMQAFMTGSIPDCQTITMETVDVNNRKRKETHYVTTVDIKNMDPCTFLDGHNFLTDQRCKQAFSNLLDSDSYSNSYAKKMCNTKCPKMPENIFVQLYFVAVTILAIYVFYRLVLMTSR